MSSDVESFNDFEYIIEVKKEDRICFGTTVARRTSPIGKGLSPQQRLRVFELFPKTGPGYYRTQLFTSALYPLHNKIRSKAGTSPLCSKVPRFKERLGFQVPSPGRYNTCKFSTHFKQNSRPFCKSGKIRENKTNSNPGPGTYNINKKICRRRNCMNNFGVPTITDAVEVFCINKPVDRCQKCEELCEGDYWHKEYMNFLCHACWKEELDSHELFTKTMLKDFKKIRNCSSMHDHQETDAAVRILPINKVRKKIQVENYLTIYNI